MDGVGISMRTQWQWLQGSLCVLVIMSFVCLFAAVDLGGDCNGICSFRLKHVF